MKTKVSRGPTRANKVTVTVFMSIEEATRFDEIAERNCRTRASELLFMVRERLSA